MKLSKKLNQVIKALEVKGLDQLRAMPTVTLNGHMKSLTEAFLCEMDEEKRETVEVLVSDINDILKDRLIDTLVADQKTDKPKKDAKKTTKATGTDKPKKTTKEDTGDTEPYEPVKPPTKEAKPAPQKSTGKTTDKPKSTGKTPQKSTGKTSTKSTGKTTQKSTGKSTEKPKKKETLKDVIKWKSLIKMTLEDSVYYCYVVDIAPNFENVITRSTDDVNIVFLFDTKALDTFTYTEPNGDKWKLEYMKKELK